MKTKGLAIILHLFVSLGLLFARVSPALAAGIIYVDDDAIGTNTGVSWENAFADLQNAIAAAGPGNQIWVAAGIYMPTGTNDRSASFMLESGVAIYGGFDGTETLLAQRNPAANVTTLSGDIGTAGDDSDNSYHVVRATGVDGAAVLDGFTVTAGNADGATDLAGAGGGLLSENASPTLAHLIFAGNSASAGGGIFNLSGNPSLADIALTNNSTNGSGGGIHNFQSSPILVRVTFSSNSADQYGGGMYSYQSDNFSVTDVGFSFNTAEWGGGGMYNDQSSPSLTDVTFSDNAATGDALGTGGSGGGMSNSGSHPSLATVTFVRNQAVATGAGMYNVDSNPTLTGVSFNDNQAALGGGGIVNYNSSPSLTNVTLEGNSTGEFGTGGGMFNSDSANPILIHVTFAVNSAANGGGMYNYNSDPTLADVTFEGNSVVNLGMGGGMLNYSNSDPALANVRFYGNLAADGAGMLNSSSSPDLVDVTFDGNIAEYAGGGVYNIKSTASLAEITFHANSAALGAGLYNQESNPTLTNVTFNANEASTYGGSLYNSISNPSLSNVTSYGNVAPAGAGLYNDVGSSPFITNSILYGDAGAEIWDSAPSTSQVNHSVVQGGYDGTGNLDVDPLLGTLQDNGGFTPTMALGAGSPAIDAGEDASCPPADQRGYPRPRGPHCDMGAFEVAQPLFVDASATGAQNGRSWTDAFTDLQDALAIASSGDQIWVADGVYVPGPASEDSFTLKDGVAIYGGFSGIETLLSQRDLATNPTVLSGDIGTDGDPSDNSYHVVTGDSVDSSAILDGFTIQAGNAATNYGGGMYNESSSPTLANLIFRENSANFGGGMANYVSSPSLTNVIFKGNTAAQGGGLYNYLSNNPSLTNTTFTGNTALTGAALGGGIYNDLSSPTLTNVTLSGNLAGSSGGGIYNSVSDPDLANVTFSGNSAISSGGGIYNEDSSPRLVNVTFHANSASPDQGGALYNNSLSHPAVLNSILYGDTGGEVHNDGAGSANITYSIVEGGYAGTGNRTEDPLLGPLAYNGGLTKNMALAAGSPALDAGRDLGCPTNDQRGLKRPQGPHCDMGAYERRNYARTIVSIAVQDGWILESTETSAKGGTLNSTAGSFRLGDEASNQQYRAILSFDTASLPPDAHITSLTLKIKRSGLVGVDPFTTHQFIRVDMRSGPFRGVDALQIEDFQAAASKGSALSIRNTPASNWYSGALGAVNFPFVNLAGLTQFRLYFKLDDDNDLAADYLAFYSGNASMASLRPKLVITYYLP
jgi:predicted outer membrane repeat protein